MKLISVFQSESVPVLRIPFTVFAPAGIWGSAPVLTIPFTVFAPAGMWSVPAVLEWGPYSWSELLQSPQKYGTSFHVNKSLVDSTEASITVDPASSDSCFPGEAMDVSLFMS